MNAVSVLDYDIEMLDYGKAQIYVYKGHKT